MSVCIDPEIGKLIGRYEFNLLSSEEKEEFEDHLLRCNACFQDLHEFSPAVDTMKKNITVFQKAVATRKPILYQLKESLVSIFPQPIRPAIPAIALAATVIIALSVFWQIFYPSSNKNSNRITQKEPTKIILHEPEEMERKATTEERILSDSTATLNMKKVLFESMKVMKGKDHENLIFVWSNIKEIKFYNIDLIIQNNKQRITPVKGIQDTSFAYPVKELKSNTPSIWELSGELTNGENFKVNKQFKINENSLK